MRGKRDSYRAALLLRCPINPPGQWPCEQWRREIDVYGRSVIPDSTSGIFHLQPKVSFFSSIDRAESRGTLAVPG